MLALPCLISPEKFGPVIAWMSTLLVRPCETIATCLEASVVAAAIVSLLWSMEHLLDDLGKGLQRPVLDHPRGLSLSKIRVGSVDLVAWVHTPVVVVIVVSVPRRESMLGIFRDQFFLPQKIDQLSLAFACIAFFCDVSRLMLPIVSISMCDAPIRKALEFSKSHFVEPLVDNPREVFRLIIVAVVLLTCFCRRVVFPDNVCRLIGPRQGGRGLGVQGYPLQGVRDLFGLDPPLGVEGDVVAAALDLSLLVPMGSAVADQIDPDGHTSSIVRVQFPQVLS